MGRNPKVGLDYFRLECHLDRKFKLIEADFGLKGFAVVVKLYQQIYGEQGYYCEWDEDVALLFASDEVKLGCNVVSEIVNAAIKRGLFDKDMFEKYHILTSHGIQKWYFESISRRERVEVIQEYLLIPDAELPKNVCRNSISVDRNAISADRNPHSTGEYSIEDEEEEEYARAREEEPVDLEWKRFVQLYEQNIGLMPHSNFELQDLQDAYDHFGYDIMAEAIKYTALRHSSNPHYYLSKVYQGFYQANVTTVEQAKAVIADHERRYQAGARRANTAKASAPPPPTGRQIKPGTNPFDY